jgi:hypothetical protein
LGNPGTAFSHKRSRIRRGAIAKIAARSCKPLLQISLPNSEPMVLYMTRSRCTQHSDGLTSYKNGRKVGSTMDDAPARFTTHHLNDGTSTTSATEAGLAPASHSKRVLLIRIRLRNDKWTRGARDRRCVSMILYHLILPVDHTQSSRDMGYTSPSFPRRNSQVPEQIRNDICSSSNGYVRTVPTDGLNEYASRCCIALSISIQHHHLS